jgi:hypothetical protein
MKIQSRNARALLGALAFAAGLAGTGCSRAPSTALASSEGLILTELPDLPGCETFAQSAPKGTVEVTPLRDYAELYFVADRSGGRCIDTLDGLTHALVRFPDTVTVHRARVISPSTRNEQAASNPMPGIDPDPYASNPMPGSDPDGDPYASNPMPGSDRSDR